MCAIAAGWTCRSAGWRRTRRPGLDACSRSSPPTATRWSRGTCPARALASFDPERGTTFAAYATVTIVGELKHHFRDHRWAVRVPRRVQELCLRVRDDRESLRHELGRAPIVAEPAGRAGAWLQPGVRKLPPCHRLLQLRFVDELTQREIGPILGVSQMQFSRLLRQILDQLRDEAPD